MNESTTKDLFSIKMQGQYVSSKWKVLIQSILKARTRLQQVKGLLDVDEVEKFRRLSNGEAYCSSLHEVLQRTPIDGSERLNVKFLEPYVPEFVIGKIQAIPGGKSIKYESKGSEDSLETVDLSHWQIKRGYCYFLAEVNLNAAIDCVNKRKFEEAMNHLSQALMQIGAASVRDPAEIAAMAASERAKKGKETADARLDPVRKYALDLAAKKAYPSYRNAAMSIKDDVIKFARTSGINNPTESQAVTTITGWLKNGGWNPSASTSKRSTSAGKRSTSAG